MSRENVVQHVKALMDDIQKNIFRKAVEYRDTNTTRADNWEEFIDIIDNKGGFILAHWDGTPETEAEIKNLTKASIRAIPFDTPDEEGRCILTGKPSRRRVLFARAY